ncbi:hypothetical protein J1902_17600 [Arthrobacter sp. PO-11]|uniref:Uncharacterized protein n=1 Tax=Arthrobacter cavernae TaxID=2817681 RepID=A0A939HF71_9MICC|nr:hypothetical protein [Arthrobacter cavernae]
MFVTKYRRRVFNNQMLTACETTMRNVCSILEPLDLAGSPALKGRLACYQSPVIRRPFHYS